MPRVFEVERADRVWQLKARGEVLSAYPHKANAVQEAEQLALSNEPSTLIVRREGGAIEYQRTFGHVCTAE